MQRLRFCSNRAVPSRSQLLAFRIRIGIWYFDSTAVTSSRSSRRHGIFMIEHKILEFRTKGRGTTEITADVGRAGASSRISEGVCTLFLQHTSASLILCENADADVRRDLEIIFA